MSTRKNVMLSALLLTGVTFATQAQTNTAGSTGATTTQTNTTGVSTGKDLAGSAALSQNHTTLLAMLRLAGLTEKAKAAGPYTVFAPTNDAFNKLPQSQRDALMKPTARRQLTGILGYHVVPGNVMAADLTDGQTIKTVQGESLTVRKSGDAVTIQDAKGNTATVVMADIQATNGVVHSIDTVLMPSK